MRDRGCAVGVESVNRILQQAVGVRDTFVLAQVFKPGFHKKSLQHPLSLPPQSEVKRTRDGHRQYVERIRTRLARLFNRPARWH